MKWCKIAISFLFAALLLCGCGGSAGSSGATGSSDPAEGAAPPDLTGHWVQSNKNSEDSFHTADITADSITVYWDSSSGDTKSLYWAGSFTAPKDNGAYSWDSANDHEQTDGALLASSDETKKFTYENGVISYEVSAMGTTTTVKLEKQ